MASSVSSWAYSGQSHPQHRRRQATYAQCRANRAGVKLIAAILQCQHRSRWQTPHPRMGHPSLAAHGGHASDGFVHRRRARSFRCYGSINGFPVTFLLTLERPASPSMRPKPADGLDYRAGQATGVNTAAGGASLACQIQHRKSGWNRSQSVDGLVVEAGLSVPLLGMSFLNGWTCGVMGRQ